MNLTVVEGRICNDVKLQERANSGSSYVIINVACRRNYKNANGDVESDFIPVTVNGKTAEFVEKYFKKGDGIVIVGRINTYKKADDTYGWTVRADEVTFPVGSTGGGKKKDEDENPFYDPEDDPL